jgi:hypothetical protein
MAPQTRTQANNRENENGGNNNGSTVWNQAPNDEVEQCCVVHGGAVLGSNMWSSVGEGHHEGLLRCSWRWH